MNQPNLYERLPREIQDGLKWYTRDSLDALTHVHYVAKKYHARGTNRCAAWDARPPATDKSYGNPWERCHTDNYWCWFVLRGE